MTVAPRIVVAGLAGDSGKTLVSLGLLLAAARSGLPVRAFKKGPDYIDAAWLAWASGHPARNLDTYLMGFEGAAAGFTRNSTPSGLNVIEGNRGLYDGVDRQGTHSTAELAKALLAPVVLVADATKVTRTMAAQILGCQKLDPAVWIAGVVLNRLGSRRHLEVIREAVEAECGVPVLGALPRMQSGVLLPGRHLGLVTPEEHDLKGELKAGVLSLVDEHLDLERLIRLAQEAPPLELPCPPATILSRGHGLTIGYLRDSAFTFYYPENLEVLEDSGAELIPIDALTSGELPAKLDALYIGGGFPETHASRLASNAAFLASVREEARRGLPVYAECGGLMLLARSLSWKGQRFPMAAVLPFDVEVMSAPQGHGYARLVVDRPNPFFPEGTQLKGHEFHYSRILLDGEAPPSACSVVRGVGCFADRDGALAGNVLASYVHLHAAASPEWSRGLLEAARRYAARRGVTDHEPIEFKKADLIERGG